MQASGQKDDRSRSDAFDFVERVPHPSVHCCGDVDNQSRRPAEMVRYGRAGASAMPGTAARLRHGRTCLWQVRRLQRQHDIRDGDLRGNGQVFVTHRHYLIFPDDRSEQLKDQARLDGRRRHRKRRVLAQLDLEGRIPLCRSWQDRPFVRGGRWRRGYDQHGRQRSYPALRRELPLCRRQGSRRRQVVTRRSARAKPKH